MATFNVKYDFSEFVFPSNDLDGRSVRLCLRVPHLLDQALEEVKESGKFPFDLKDDVVRWCLHEGLRKLDSMEACVSVMPLLEITVTLAQAKFDQEMFQDFFTNLDSAIFGLCNSGYQTHSARRVVKAIEELVLCMPLSRHRNRYLRGLRKRWGHLLIGSTEQPTVTGTGGCHGE
jgi:hypothetical protein